MKKSIFFLGLFFYSVLTYSQWNVSFQDTAKSSNLFYSLYFTDANTGFGVDFFGNILKTTNGGQNWVTLASGTTQPLYQYILLLLILVIPQVWVPL